MPQRNHLLICPPATLAFAENSINWGWALYFFDYKARPRKVLNGPTNHGLRRCDPRSFDLGSQYRPTNANRKICCARGTAKRILSPRSSPRPQYDANEYVFTAATESEVMSLDFFSLQILPDSSVTILLTHGSEIRPPAGASSKMARACVSDRLIGPILRLAVCVGNFVRIRRDILQESAFLAGSDASN